MKSTFGDEFFYKNVASTRTIKTRRNECNIHIISIIWTFPLYEYTHRGQTFADTTQQVIAALFSGIFFAAVYYRNGSLTVPIAIHGFCNYTNFIMNEFLNYTYTPPALFNALDTIIPLLYVLCGVVVLLRSDQFQQLS